MTAVYVPSFLGWQLEENNQTDNLVNALVESEVVVDTSTLLVTGTTLIDLLRDCVIVIPSVVIIELEGMRGSDSKGYLSRQWLRLIEELRVEHGEKLTEGVMSPRNGVTIRIQPNDASQTSLPEVLRDGSADSTILAVAKNIVNRQKDSESKTKVALLSNDVPMRIRATVLCGLDAYEMSSADLERVEPFHGIVDIELTQEEYADSPFVNPRAKVDRDYIAPLLEDDEFTASHLMLNVYLEDSDHVQSYAVIEDKLVPVGNHDVEVSSVRARTPEQATAVTYLRQSPDTVPINTIGGGAGTGKTLLALAAGLEGVCAFDSSQKFVEKPYDKVIVFRSLHEMGRGQELGFLPGSVEEKMSVWGEAISDALKTINKEMTRNNGAHSSMDVSELIDVSPISYLRGRSIDNAFIILEEAQNFSKVEILNVISRAGEGSKIVLTFDPTQVDNRFLQSGDKAEVWSVINRLKNDPLFAHITLQKTERSRVAELASQILEEG